MGYVKGWMNRMGGKAKEERREREGGWKRRGKTGGFSDKVQDSTPGMLELEETPLLRPFNRKISRSLWSSNKVLSPAQSSKSKIAVFKIIVHN